MPYANPEDRRAFSRRNYAVKGERIRERALVTRTARRQDPAYVERLRNYERNRKAERTAFLRAYKLEHGCADCGYKQHPAALDFDHLGEKLFSIADNGWRYSMEKLLAELEKCEVVCANCHRIRTEERGYG